MKRKKSEKYRESKITTINVFGFTLYMKFIFCSKTWFERSSLYHHILFTDFMRCMIFERQ